MERLDEIANKTSETNSILNKEFYDIVKRNNEELEELRKVQYVRIFAVLLAD